MDCAVLPLDGSSCFPRSARLVATALAWAALGAPAGQAAPDCGAYEDGVRATYRRIGWSDFKASRRPAALSGARLVAYVTTSIDVSAQEIEVRPELDGSWTASLVDPCVRAFLLKKGS